MMAEALRAELQVIASILQMVTVKNNSGFPTLIPSNGDCSHSLGSMLDIGHDNQFSPVLLMNVIAMLLVRNEEIGTVVCIPNQLEDATNTSALPRGFIAFTNTSLMGSRFHKDTKHLVKLVETGKSHWPTISLLDPKDILDLNKLR